MGFLKWKRQEVGHQETHSGVYWVERDPDGGNFGRWHSYRIDIDEQLTFEGFSTREEAKAYCEADAREVANQKPQPICEVCGAAGDNPCRGSCPNAGLIPKP